MHHALSETQPANFPRDIAQLKSAGYRPRSVKQEMRENAIEALRTGQAVFPGFIGYEDSVLPQLLQAVLSQHDILLLGLRGQAKTRLLRAMTVLLDEWIPIIDDPGVDLPDDPLLPSTSAGRRAIARHADATPIRWLHRSRRYHEKLATPDSTIADLIGEIDLVKHAEGRYLSDEATLHFGLIPRANRGLFVINELPDLPPRIQVGLFNVLEERDIQIRGHPVRMELDLSLMFSANPEDYTNRGRIVTPLKDRIGSVVRTHYPANNAEAMRITRENAFIQRVMEPGASPALAPSKEHISASFSKGPAHQPPSVELIPIMHELVEETIRLARKSSHINQASGVSVRASIAAIECLVSAAEIRALATRESRVVPRIVDAEHLAAALRGKVELMIAEDAPDGSSTEDRLIHALLGEALKSLLARYLDLDAIEPIAEPFSRGLKLALDDRTSAASALDSMRHVEGLLPAAKNLCKRLELDHTDDQFLACAGELVLEFLYVNHRLSKMTGRAGKGYAK